MQGLFNVLSVASFAMSSALLGGTILFYTRIPSLTENYINQLTSEVLGKTTELMPDKIEQAVPKLPTETGLPVPLK